MKLPPALQARWDALAAREKNLVLGAAAVIAVAVVWWVAIGPALQTLRTSAEQHRALDAQVQAMKGLAAQAQALKSQPRMNYDEALRALEASTRQRLGSGAQLTVLGERATVTLRAVPAEALSQWLAQARINARALPAEARLTRGAAPAGAAGAGGVAGAGGGAHWDGTLVLSLPPR